MDTIITTTLVRHTCGECGITFGLEKTHMDNLKETGAVFHCPNGHQRIFTHKQNLENQLTAQRAKFESMLAWEKRMKAEAEADRDRMKFVVRAEKAAKTKLKKRIAKGVCPCCNRHFNNLQRHMDSKHPAFVDDGIGSAKP